MKRALDVIVVTAIVLLGSTIARTAHACGGCFNPPRTVQTVNSHRMVLALSTRQTTLWDQFSYAGDPSNFSWILPIRYSPDVRIELADNRFMQMLDDLSAPVVFIPQAPPPRFCRGCNRLGGDASSADAASDSGVVVHREEVVGPYAIAIVGSADPMALRTWLADNGFAVPPSVIPVIDHYVALRSDFVALRLRSGAGISRMSPIRVTTPGYQPTLPLRMIAAGVADRVGLQLLVLADSRIAAQNFPNGEILETDLVYDFNAPTDPVTDFLAAFRRINVANANRVWLTESSVRWIATALVSQADALARFDPIGRDAGFCADPPTADSGADSGETLDGDMDAMSADSASATDAGPRCREPDLREDLRVALDGLNANPYLTRLRADLPIGQLDRDLVLQAGPVAERRTQYNYGVVRNRPPDPGPCPPPPVDCGVPVWPPPSWLDGGATGADASGARDANADGAGPRYPLAGGGCAARCAVGWSSRTKGGVVVAVALAAIAVSRRKRRAQRAMHIERP